MMILWSFGTAHFTVALHCEDEQYPDLSWADADTLEKINGGEWGCYEFRVAVTDSQGNVLGESFLGGSIYENPREFRDHIGAAGKWGSYFTGMVGEAITEARRTWNNRPAVRLKSA